LVPGVAPTVNDQSWPDGYRICVWVFTAIARIASAAGSVPWNIKRRKGSDWEDVENSALGDLLDTVNADIDTMTLMEMTAGWMALYGNAYWHLMRPTPRSVPTAIRILPANLIEAIPGRGVRSNVVSGYRLLTGAREVLPDIDVVHFRSFSTNPIYGLPPMAPLEPIVNMFSALTRYKYSLVKSGGVPATVLLTDKPKLSEKEREEFNALWSMWRTPENANHPFLLGSNSKLQPVGVDPDRIGAIELAAEARDTILGAYGVPPVVAGVLQNANYNTARSQRKQFWTETITPLYLRKIAGGVNEQMAWQFEGVDGRDIRAFPDTSQVEALQEDKREAAETAKIWVLSGIRTPNEIREEYGWPPHPDGDSLKPLSGGAGDGFGDGSHSHDESTATEKALRDLLDAIETGSAEATIPRGR